MSYKKAINKNHWYDGLFYDKIIAPNQDKAFNIIKKIIDEDSTILDAGCGTGRLGILLSEFCSRYDGVDLSIKNITTANKKLHKNNISNVRFFHNDVLDFIDETDSKYDYAVLSYIIHEVDENLRNKILMKLSMSAEQVIIIDYLFPKPKNISGALISVVEFMAGRDHFRNFNSYMSDSGIDGLVKASGLTVTKEIRKNSTGTHIAILERK